MRKWSEEGQLLNHKATLAFTSPSRAHGKMGGQRALPAKPEVDWMNVEGLMRLALKGNSKFQYYNMCNTGNTPDANLLGFHLG